MQWMADNGNLFTFHFCSTKIYFFNQPIINPWCHRRLISTVGFWLSQFIFLCILIFSLGAHVCRIMQIYTREVIHNKIGVLFSLLLHYIWRKTITQRSWTRHCQLISKKCLIFNIFFSYDKMRFNCFSCFQWFFFCSIFLFSFYEYL